MNFRFQHVKSVAAGLFERNLSGSEGLRVGAKHSQKLVVFEDIARKGSHYHEED